MTKYCNARMLTGEIVDFTEENGEITALEVKAQIQQPDDDAVLLQDLSDQLLTSIATVDCQGELILPAGVDVHVHSRDPGHTKKEDWASLARGAFKGGVVAVCDMPNTLPPTMSKEEIIEKSEIAGSSGLEFRLYLGVGKGNINNLMALLEEESLRLCGLKVYYGQSTGELMYDDLETLAKVLDPKMPGMLVFHSEDQCMIDHNEEKISCVGVDPKNPSSFEIHSKIRNSASAWGSTKVILEWAKKWDRRIHIAHISTPGEMELIEKSRSEGVKVTTEVAPHHLIFSTDDYDRLGSLIKMNPPVRSPEELRQLRDFFKRGLIECFATDHAPHLLEEKQNPYKSCPSGVPSIEYFWPLLLKLMTDTGMAAQTALDMGAAKPAKMFGFPKLGKIDVGFDASFVWVSEIPHTVKNKETVSKCGWSPYDGTELMHKVTGTWKKGHRVYIQ